MLTTVGYSHVFRFCGGECHTALPSCTPADGGPAKSDGIPCGRASSRSIIGVIGVRISFKKMARLGRLSKTDSSINGTFDKAKEMFDGDDMFGSEAVRELCQCGHSMTDVRPGVDRSMVKTAYDLEVWEDLVLGMFIRRRRFKRCRRIQRSEDRIRVLHAESVQHIRQVPFLR